MPSKWLEIYILRRSQNILEIGLAEFDIHSRLKMEGIRVRRVTREQSWYEVCAPYVSEKYAFRRRRFLGVVISDSAPPASLR